jgi:hypothetical protein
VNIAGKVADCTRVHLRPPASLATSVPALVAQADTELARRGVLGVWGYALLVALLLFGTSVVCYSRVHGGSSVYRHGLGKDVRLRPRSNASVARRYHFDQCYKLGGDRRLDNHPIPPSNPQRRHTCLLHTG